MLTENLGWSIPIAYLELFIGQLSQLTPCEALCCQLDQAFMVKVEGIDDKCIPQTIRAGDHDALQIRGTIIADQTVVRHCPSNLNEAEPGVRREELVTIALEKPSFLADTRKKTESAIVDCHRLGYHSEGYVYLPAELGGG